MSPGPNCWEVRRCGREPNGILVPYRGVCKAASAGWADGLHGGRYGGRVCWAIAGTFAPGLPTCRALDSGKTCTDCAFYWDVRRQEGWELLSPVEIQARASGPAW